MIPPTTVPQPQSTARRQVEFLKRQAWLIVLVVIVALAIAAAATASQQKVYRASAKIFVGSSGTLNPQFGNVIQPFTQTMSSLLMSEIVARRVVENLGLSETPSHVLSNLHVTSTPDNAVLEVAYDADHPQKARRVLAEVGVVFTRLVQQKLGHPSAKGVPVVTATVFDPAHASSTPVSPHPVRTLAFAGALALGLGLVLALLRDTLDERVRGRDEMEELFGAPITTALPRSMLTRPVLDPVNGVDHSGLRAVDPLRLQLAREGAGEGLITVTSGGAQDGQSAVAASISVALALAGEHVICVDVSPERKHSLSYYLNVTPSHAAAGRIEGAGDVDSALREIGLDAARENPRAVGDNERGRLQLLQLTEGALSSADAFPSWSIADLVEELKSQASRVIVDAPAIPSAATFALLSVTDGVIAVGREGRTTKEQATRVRNAIDTLKIETYALVYVGKGAYAFPPMSGRGTSPLTPSRASASGGRDSGRRAQPSPRRAPSRTRAD